MAEREQQRQAWEGEMFRLLAGDVLDYAIFIVDQDRHVLSWGKGAERLLGFTQDEIVGQKIDRFFTPEDVRDGVPQRELDEAVATGRGDGDRWHVRKDGNRFWSSGTVTPLREGGALRGFAKVMRDRTELKRAHDARDDALAYADTIVQTVREPLVVLDGGLRVRTANRSFYAAFRVRPEDTEGRPLYELGNGQWDVPALRTLLGEVLPRDASFDGFEVEHDFPGVGRKVMLLNARKLSREGNHSELILLAIEDVTALREAERARRDAETRFTEMVRNVRDHSIFLTDADGVITSWNVAAERIIGYAEAEAVGRHFCLIFTPEDVEAGIPGQELRQAREEGRAEDERWHRRKDGTPFWALGIVTPLYDPQGRLSGFSKILRDMTEWKRADEEGRERSRQLEFVTDNAPVLLAQVDAGRRFRFVNRPYAGRFGLHPRDLVGRPVREVVGEEAYARIGPHIDRALSGESVEYEADVPYAGIGVQVVRVAYEPERDGEGRVVGYVAAILNVTDRRRAEDQLAASRARLQALFDTTQDAILLADDEARYVDANPAACALLGYGREELLRLGVFDVTPQSNGEAGRAAWAAFVRDGRQAGEYAVRLRDGSTAVVEYRAVANVQPGLHLSSLRDVTRRRRDEEALRASEERFARFMQHLPGLAWVKDAQGRYVYANDAATKAFGRPPEELYGRTDEEVFPPATAARFRENDLAALAAAGVRVVETLEQPDGVLHHSLVSKFPIPGTDGGAALVGGMAIDITEEMRTRAVLEESEERFRATFEQAAVGIAHVGLDGHWLRVNRKLCDVVGYGPDELRGLTFQDVTHPDDLEADLAHVRRLVAGEVETYSLEKRYARKDRSYVWVNLTVSLVRTPEGRPKYFISVVEDVSEKRRVQDALRDSEQRLRALSDNLPDGAVYQTLATPDGGRRFAFISAGVERLFGVSAAEAMADAAALYGLVHEDDRLRLASAEQAALRDSAPFHCEFRSRTRQGVVIWVECRSAPRRLPTGEVVWEGVVTDVTARKQAEQELARVTAGSERQRRLYEAVLNTTPDFAYVFDRDHRFVYVNEALLAAWGRTWGEARGRTCLELGYEPWHAAKHDREIEEVVATRRPIRGEVPFEAAGTGGRRTYDYFFTPVLGPGGEVEAVAGTTRDVTERKRMEEELRRTAAELSEANRRKDNFLATLAHELRNPLAPLRNGLQLLRLAGDDRATAGQALGMMERQLQQMVRLIDDLLDVSRITQGKLQLRKERVELAAVVRSAVETARPLVEASAHRLTVSLPPGPVWLDADPTRLAQVLSNLLTNAAKYTNRGGDVRLAAECDGVEAVVSVRDTGIGIAPEHLPRLFEMFSQVDSALDRSQGGLGIGLSLVRGLAEMHGGSVEARSEGAGKGSEFVVRLPAAAGTAPAAEDAAGEAATPRRARRILVADDNRDAADSLAIMLRLQGHEVHTTHDGQEAVEAAAWFRPDVALLDVGMPRLNGYQAARRIREQPWGGSVVLVAVTGWGQEEDKRRAAEAGFDEHVTKPVEPAALDRLLASLSPR